MALPGIDFLPQNGMVSFAIIGSLSSAILMIISSISNTKHTSTSLKEITMERRLSYAKAAPEPYKALDAFSDACEASGLDPLMLVLVQMRASQINGCAFCLDMHSKDAKAMGESEHRLHGLLAWREVDYYSEKE